MQFSHELLLSINTMSQQIFKDLIARVGDQHKYQKILLVIGCLQMLEAASTSFVNAFLFYQDDYTCEASFSNCREYVCSLPVSQQTAFSNADFSSMVSRFGNYRCQEGGQLDWLQTFIYFAGIIGAILSVILLTCLTHRQELIITYLLNIIGLGITLASSSIYMASFGLFLNFMGRIVQSGLIVSFVSESLATEKRGEYLSWMFLGYGFAASAVALVYWVIHPWQLAMTVYQILPYVVVLILTLFFIEESPFELVTTKSSKDSMDAFRRIGAINGIQCEIREEELIAIRQEYDENNKQKHDHEFSMIDLFHYSSLRWLTLLTFFHRFLLAFQFAGPQLVLKDFHMNIYLNGVLVGLSEIIGAVVCLRFQNLLPRRKTIFALELIGCLVLLGAFAFASCNHSQECSALQAFFQTLCLFIFRFLVSLSYNIFLIQLTELYPSQIKPIAMQFNSFGNTSPYLIIPFLQSLFQRMHVSIIICFCVVSGLTSLLILPLPQTLGITPPQMIEELAYESQVRMREHPSTVHRPT